MIRFYLFLIFILAAGTSFVRAQPPLVVILLPGTSLQDWQSANAPALHRLMRTGSLAVMNTRTARLPNDHTRETPESAVLTLGAGARAAGGPDALAFLPEQTAGALYRRRLGYLPLPGQFVNTNWPVLLHSNTRLGYQIRLGNLADALAIHKVALLTGGGPFAAAAASTNAGSVFRASHMTLVNGECLIWDLGSNIALADAFITDAAAQTIRQHGRLLVLSPFANDHDYSRGRRLTPVLEWGEGIPSGLLFSPSTHRLGLVTNTDFAPTVAAYFGLAKEDFPIRPFGDVWTAAPTGNAALKLHSLESQGEKQAQGMRLLPYLAVVLGMWMLGGTTLLFAKRLPPMLSLVPLIFLTGALFSNGLLSFSAACVGLLLIVYVLSRLFLPSQISLYLLVLIAGSLLIDMLTGSRLMQRNLLGYSAIEGARYYGIGNEAMGVLIGALLVIAARLWKPHQSIQWMIFLTLTVVSLLLGSANAGAKAGGLLVSLFAFGTLGFTLLGGRWSIRVILISIFGVIVITGTAALTDALWWHGAHSHLGENVRRIQLGGFSEAGDIITRKLAVETRLAYHSAWAFPLWGGLICLGLLKQSRQEVTSEDLALKYAGFAAIAACVLLNDAGVVAGAFCLIPLWCDSLVYRQIKRPLQGDFFPAKAVLVD
jgi:hypothetical protein